MSNRKLSIHSVGIVTTIAVEVAVAIFLQGLDGISDALGPFGTLLARSVGWGIAVSFGVYLVVALRHLWNGDNGIDDDVRLFRYELAARGRSGCPADDGWERKRTRGRGVVVQEAGLRA